MKYVMLIVFSLVLMWLSFAFISLEPNMFEWEPDIRALYLIMSLGVIAPMSILAEALIE